jgi:uncharacterized protein YndB with AHSA1/START domain
VDSGIARVSDAGVVTVAIEFPIAAPPERLWSALVKDTAKWWPVEHRICGPGSRMTFEPRPGGRLFEEGADGAGLLWYTVLAITPGESVTLVGHIAPPWGGPATSLLRLAVEARGDGSMLSVTDSLFGSVDEKFAASTNEGRRAILGDALNRHVERG